LKTHMQVHAENRPEKLKCYCDYCGASYARRDYVWKHILWTHKPYLADQGLTAYR
jgi:hypothetical protein